MVYGIYIYVYINRACGAVVRCNAVLNAVMNELTRSRQIFISTYKYGSWGFQGWTFLFFFLSFSAVVRLTHVIKNFINFMFKGEFKYWREYKRDS